MSICEVYKGYDIEYQKGKGIYRVKKVGKVLSPDFSTKQEAKDWIDEQTKPRVVSTYRGKDIWWSQKWGYYWLDMPGTPSERKMRSNSISGCEKSIDSHMPQIEFQEEQQANREAIAAKNAAANAKRKADRLAEQKAAADKIAADKAAAEADRLRREAEEAAKPPVNYDEKRDTQKKTQDIALDRTKPTIEPLVVEVPEPIPDITTEPIKPPTEEPAWIDTFIFTIRSEFGKLMEMFK